jgi:hypothetical protein
MRPAFIWLETVDGGFCEHGSEHFFPQKAGIS